GGGMECASDRCPLGGRASSGYLFQEVVGHRHVARDPLHLDAAVALLERIVEHPRLAGVPTESFSGGVEHSNARDDHDLLPDPAGAAVMLEPELFAGKHRVQTGEFLRFRSLPNLFPVLDGPPVVDYDVLIPGDEMLDRVVHCGTPLASASGPEARALWRPL